MTEEELLADGYELPEDIYVSPEECLEYIDELEEYLRIAYEIIGVLVKVAESFLEDSEAPETAEEIESVRIIQAAVNAVNNGTSIAFELGEEEIENEDD
jgi:hypothetical protein